ncbi:13978_t:CDS:2, partial [Gigaspora margarita]
TRWNSSYIVWTRLLQLCNSINIMYATILASSDKQTKKEAQVTELLGGSKYSTIGFITLNDEFKAINLDDMNTIFDEEEEDLV